MKILSLLMLLLTLTLLPSGAYSQSQEEGLVKTYYDHLSDTTLIFMSLGPLQLNPPRSIKPRMMVLSAQYKGKNKIKPEFVRLDVNGISRWSVSDERKTRLLIFADGMALDAGRAGQSSYFYSWDLDFERMQFSLPFEQFLQVVNARKVRPQLDGVGFAFTDIQLKWLRAFAKELQEPAPNHMNGPKT